MDTLREILKDINENPEVVLQHKDNKYLENFMMMALLPNFRALLPEGTAPFTPSKGVSDVETKSVVWQFLRKLGNLKNPEIHQLKRETMFIQLLEEVSEKEAEVFVAMKDQKLYTIYPNITLDNMIQVGYFPRGIH